MGPHHRSESQSCESDHADPWPWPVQALFQDNPRWIKTHQAGGGVLGKPNACAVERANKPTTHPSVSHHAPRFSPCTIHDPLGRPATNHHPCWMIDAVSASCCFFFADCSSLPRGGSFVWKTTRTHPTQQPPSPYHHITTAPDAYQMTVHDDEQ